MRFLAPMLAALLAGGCAYERVWGYPEVRPERPGVAAPLTHDAVLRLVQAGVSDDIILEKIRADGLVARPTAEQIVLLRNRCVSDRVIEAMVAARVPAAEEISAPPRMIYRDTAYPGPFWICGPWWPWGGWYPHGTISWRWHLRH